MKPKLLIVTDNALKFKELSTGLEEFFNCEQKVLDEPEIQGSPEEIIKHKLISVHKVFGEMILVDDVSLHLDELNGFPGPYIKDFLRCFTPYETGVKFFGSKVKAVCWLGLLHGEGKIIIAQGVVNGKIVKPKGKDHKDRHFDLFFQADGTDRPMIEYSADEKNKFSHRGKAMKNLLKLLKEKN